MFEARSSGFATFTFNPERRSSMVFRILLLLNDSAVSMRNLWQDKCAKPVGSIMMILKRDSTFATILSISLSRSASLKPGNVYDFYLMTVCLKQCEILPVSTQLPMHFMLLADDRDKSRKSLDKTPTISLIFLSKSMVSSKIDFKNVSHLQKGNTIINILPTLME